MIADTLALFHPGRVVEVRAIGVPRKGRRVTASGYFDDFVAAEEAVANLEDAEGVYFTLNEIHPGLLARCPNRIQYSPQRTTSDKDVVRVRWALIDVGPVRPSGISSTDYEVNEAKQVAADVLQFIMRGVRAQVVRAFSGNGWHILVEVNDSGEYLSDVTRFLNREFATDLVSIDASVTKRAQLTKLYGTMARKGFEIGDRKHRRSYVLWNEQNC